MRFSDLTGRSVAVWGFGREGQAVVRECRALGLQPVVAEPDLEAPHDREAPPGAPADPALRYGAEARAALLGADVVVKSPGVPATSPLYRELLAAGVRLTSLTDLWLSEHHARTVAVTGTKGKSTTAALLDHLLRGLGVRSALLGNIGTPVLDEPAPAAEVAVLEVSSYQAQSVTVSPRAVVVTSLFPEHLTWHGSAEQYMTDKLHLLDFAPELVVCPGDDDALVARVRTHLGPDTALVLTDATTVHRTADGDVAWPDGYVVPREELPLLGLHNAGNVALALRTLEALGRLPADARDAARAALATFAPLPHRMERVPSDDGRTWIDDSLATAPEATVATLRALPDEQVVAIVGGADRGLDYAPLLDQALGADRLLLVLIGPTGRRLAAEIAERGLDVAHRAFDSFAEAARWAHDEGPAASLVLLSPAAASYDEFSDYRARAAAFREAALGRL